jgi:hypothetical protein
MRLLLFLACAATVSAHAQTRSELWFGAGIRREITPDIVVGFQTNARVETEGRLQTLFQEASIKSEHLKWFRPSIDYRFITSYALNGNTTYSHRFNINADFRKKIKDVKIGARARYQVVTGGGRTGTDLDPAIRFKPYVEWSIPKSRFTPEFSTEFFYNPVYEDFGRQFNRVRFGIGTAIDLPGPHTIGITYYYGRKYATSQPYSEHIFSLDYGFEWKKAKDKEGSGKSLNDF